MFIRGLAKVGRVGEYESRGWKMENWYKYPNLQTTSLIPGVSNTTAVAGGVGIAALAAAAYAAYKFFK